MKDAFNKLKKNKMEDTLENQSVRRKKTRISQGYRSTGSWKIWHLSLPMRRIYALFLLQLDRNCIDFLFQSKHLVVNLFASLENKSGLMKIYCLRFEIVREWVCLHFRSEPSLLFPYFWGPRLFSLLSLAAAAALAIPLPPRHTRSGVSAHSVGHCSPGNQSDFSAEKL